MLRLGILTTDTPHHRYFLRQLETRLPAGVEIAFNLFETRRLFARRLAWRHFLGSLPNIWTGLALNPYMAMGAYDGHIRKYEAKKFFPNGNDNLPKSFPSHIVHSVNDREAIEKIDVAEPDLLLVYGTGLIKPRVFDRPPLGAVNAHGGKLPRYRGLDTNLWAAYEGHPEAMTVSLHKMDLEFDRGPIYLEKCPAPEPYLSLISLRY